MIGVKVMVMPPVDKQKMEEVKKTSTAISAEIRVDHEKHEISLKLTPTTPDSFNLVKRFIPNFADTMAAQLSTFFGIRGRIIDIGKK